MKAATLKEVKTELNYKSHSELLEICLRLSRFKKENKELLTYLLFEISDEEKYIESIQIKIDLEFVIKSSPTILFQYLSTPSGLVEWFCDDVNIKGSKQYTFVWDGEDHPAELAKKIQITSK
jgi:hypothetical protein